jgi:hypothetical protein
MYSQPAPHLMPEYASLLLQLTAGCSHHDVGDQRLSLRLQVKSYFLLLDLGNEELSMQAFDDLLDSATWVAAMTCHSSTVLSLTPSDACAMLV